jgi:hypothetical protein
MKATIFSFACFTLVLGFGFGSCGKKCEIQRSDVNSGVIVANSVVYPISGYMTLSMGGDYVVDSLHSYYNCFNYNIDGGDRTPIDYNQYKILANPTKTSCNVSFDRSVTVDHDLDKVTYKIIASYCENCGSEMYVENYVLVPTFPDFYQVEYVVEYKKFN